MSSDDIKKSLKQVYPTETFKRRAKATTYTGLIARSFESEKRKLVFLNNAEDTEIVSITEVDQLPESLKDFGNNPAPWNTNTNDWNKLQSLWANTKPSDYYFAAQDDFVCITPIEYFNKNKCHYDQELFISHFLDSNSWDQMQEGAFSYCGNNKINIKKFLCDLGMVYNEKIMGGGFSEEDF